MADMRSSIVITVFSTAPGIGKTVISLRRLPRHDQLEPTPILLTIPELEYCERVTEVKMDAKKLVTSFGKHPIISFKYDAVEFNITEDRLEFYYGEDMVGWMAAEEYVLKVKKKKKSE